MNAEKNSELWRLAKKKAAFKIQLRSYIPAGVGFWLIWYFTSENHDLLHAWPLYLMGLWALGLIGEAVKAHVLNPNQIIEREYEKLVSNSKK